MQNIRHSCTFQDTGTEVQGGVLPLQAKAGHRAFHGSDSSILCGSHPPERQVHQGEVVANGLEAFDT